MYVLVDKRKYQHCISNFIVYNNCCMIISSQFVCFKRTSKASESKILFILFKCPKKLVTRDTETDKYGTFGAGYKRSKSKKRF
ncbi:hypothetical protein L596_022063 [Steinernema carpocapsae]|uniref:Uncharacterized protein n=1 Tax=Steinernema carpocapsae TaxID=34508 RepID=A0A4U5MKP5_STECR|nr:hypothetical protein L596_022063 [Steinernema carpocapsae]